MRKKIRYILLIAIVLIIFSIFFILQKRNRLYTDSQLAQDMTDNPPKWFKDECFQFCLSKVPNYEWVTQIYYYDLEKEKFECICRNSSTYLPKGVSPLIDNFSIDFKKENWFKWECYNKTNRIEFEVCLCSKEEDQQTHDACLYESAKKWGKEYICNNITREWVKNNCFALFK